MARTGKTTQESDVEVWKSAMAGRVVLKQFNSRGELHDMMIAPGKSFTVSPQERRINQEMAANETLDPFSNGMLVPVKLIETDEDTAAIASNPNLMSEDDMAVVFDLEDEQFASRLEQVSNPITLARLLEVARDVDARMSKVEVLKARLDAVRNPVTTRPDEEEDAPKGRTRRPRVVTPD